MTRLRKVEIVTECGEESVIYVSQDVAKIMIDGEEYGVKNEAKPAGDDQTCLNCHHHEKRDGGHYCKNPDSGHTGLMDNTIKCGASHTTHWKWVGATPVKEDTRLPIELGTIQLRDLMNAIENGIQQENWNVRYFTNTEEITIRWCGDELPRRVFRVD